MTNPINILDAALAVEGGDSETITLGDNELSIRKNFTGSEVHKIIKWINAVKPDGEVMTLDEQMHGLYAVLSDSKAGAVKKYVEHLLTYTLGEIRAVNSAVFKLNGLADEAGNFRFGA